jgi:4-hydroxybenzoate polyprenyltransferase
MTRRPQSGKDQRVNLMQKNVASTPGAAAPRELGRFGDYLAIMRLDHGAKQVFILPGAVLAYLLRGNVVHVRPMMIALGLLTAVCIASANYVINEWLDRDFDKHHPTKHNRAAVQRELRGNIVWLQWLGLTALGLLSAMLASKVMFLVAVVFGLQGIVYNVRPMRTKDKPYLDVISESINNPLRLMIGWAMIDSGTLPPSSIILSYWCGGAFLMAAKRFSEYREIVGTHGKDLLVRYRASFAGYSEASLNVSCFTYGLFSSFFLAVFLIKYRIEYLLLMPIVTLLFAQYLGLAMKPGSSAQSPEKLYHEYGLLATIVALAITFVLATFVNVPVLSQLVRQQFIEIR